MFGHWTKTRENYFYLFKIFLCSNQSLFNGMKKLGKSILEVDGDTTSRRSFFLFFCC